MLANNAGRNNMSREVPKVSIDQAVKENRTTVLLPGCIPGATPYHHTILKGSVLKLASGAFHHILIVVTGEVQFSTDGNQYIFHERVSFIPNPKLGVEVLALTDVQILEIRWDFREGDDTLAAEYMTQFPLIQIYRNSKQYRDRNKSEKTISRSCVDQRRIPRFAFGSVETYGIDAVKSHDHPMLDQYFFSFPENEMDVLIDFEPIHMKGNELLYIPLGSMHGVDVKEGEHCHYLWIDFYPDNDLALKRLDSSHIPTGKHVEFKDNGEKK
jgi:hypothetical protein